MGTLANLPLLSKFHCLFYFFTFSYAIIALFVLKINIKENLFFVNLVTFKKKNCIFPQCFRQKKYLQFKKRSKTLRKRFRVKTNLEITTFFDKIFINKVKCMNT